jgi:hypothetical protein
MDITEIRILLYVLYLEMIHAPHLIAGGDGLNAFNFNSNQARGAMA